MKDKTILVTGGAGFIGSHLVRHFVSSYPRYHIYNLDALTYAGNLENLKDIESKENYTFLHGDISNEEYINSIFDEFKFEFVIHLAAESHVDRSINDPLSFIKTNIVGTTVLLNAFKNLWEHNWEDKLFYHISTDEVYGSLSTEGMFSESTPYSPNSPYSASKASSDHLVRAYGKTYKMPYLISNCSNNYGPFQFPEKLIPLTINNISKGEPIPVYAKGENVRDWLFVEDHIKAMDLIFHSGISGEKYNIGGSDEIKNIDLVRTICSLMDKKLNNPKGTSEKLITYVKDRPGHDFRYAINNSKIKKDLGWTPSVSLYDGLSKTIDWYLNNTSWLDSVTSGSYQDYYKNQYLQI